MSTTREDGTAEVYGYDTSMRLTQVDYGTSKTVVYTLDALGNRTSEVQTVRPPSGPAVTTTWSGTFNAFNQQLTRNRSGGGLPALNTTFAYDDNGNTLTETTVVPATVVTYSWNRDNRLVAVAPPTGLPTSYQYDASGHRMQRVEGAGVVNYLLDGQSVLAELDAAGAVATRFLNSPQQIDDVISYQRAGVTEYPLVDALGSVYASTDSSGNVVHRYDFDVYGVRTDLGGSAAAVDIGYTSHFHDVNGLVNGGGADRIYMPRDARFLEPDRAGMVDGPNIYGYVMNRPTSLTDPTGRYAIFVEGVFSYERLRGALATWQLQWAAYDTDEGMHNFSFTVTSAFGSRQRHLSSYLKYLADPITFDFAECPLLPALPATSPIGGLGNWFDFPLGHNYQLIKMYPGEFSRHPKSNRPDFVAAVMFYAWGLASMLRDPAGPLDLPPLWSAKTDHYTFSPDPPGVAAKELAIQAFPGALWP